MRPFMALLVFMSMSMLQCKSSMQLESTYTYTDQNNNVFFISSEMIQYKPMEASQSSSGIYDGGKKASVAISEVTYKTIAQKANSLFESKSKMDRREMLTAVLFRKNKESTTKIILRKSPSRKDFELYLRSFLK